MEFELTDRVAELAGFAGKEALEAAVERNMTRENMLRCVRALDATTLDVTDSETTVTLFCENLLDLLRREGLPDVASVCISPLFVEDAGLALEKSDIGISAVVGGFPLSHTFVEVKMLEIAMAVENGADELDFVADVGSMLQGGWDIARSEIQMVKEEVGDDALFKVIIESGVFGSPEMVEQAARTVMEGGADFVKTSTGKSAPGATPLAVAAICRAIRTYEAESGRKVGIKISGGVSEPRQAVAYLTIVEQMLGSDRITPDYFRIGASSLLGRLAEAIRQSK